MTDVIVIGAGASGLAAAGMCASCNKSVLVLDRNEKTGKKLYITGKGRCNLTNNCEPRDFLRNVVSGRKFLYSSLFRYPPYRTMEFFENLGLKVKTERGGRVFPISDKSSDVIKALTAYAADNGAQIRLNSRAVKIDKGNGVFCVRLDGGEVLKSRKLIIACGGKSYSSTGSSGDGYIFAERFGHTVVKTVGALVPLRLKDDVKALEGLALKNVSVTAEGNGFSESAFGEMLFTSDGVSGPTVLTLSSMINRKDLKGAKLVIDLKPALDCKKLDERILSDFAKQSNKQLKNALFDLLPRSLIPFIISYCSFDGTTYINSVTKEQRDKLLNAIKRLTFHIDSLYGVENAIVTAGGVDLKEINPTTMESKLVENLYFAGETLDVDALTGGYNIQIALSTGFAAGESAGGNNGN